MAGPRFLLSEQDVNEYQADAWLSDQHKKLADDWLQQQTRLGSGFDTPPAQNAPLAAPEPTPAPTPIETPPAPEPATPAPAQPSALLDLNQPAPVAPDAPLPSPSPLPPAPASVATGPAAALPSGGLVDYARQAAQRAGIDPDLFVRQINQESGFNPSSRSPAGAIGIAQIVPRWHPNVDPTNPTASLDYAANLMSSLIKQHGGDISKALVAYNGGQGAVDALNAGKPYAESQTYLSSILGGSGQTAASVPSAPGDVSLSQFGDKTISYEDAYSACGPAAAARLASVYGNNIPLSVALEAAKRVGWTPGGGMNGIANEKKLMDALGLPATLDTSGDWNAIISGAQSGPDGHSQMVTISTPLHYFSASGTRQRSDGQTELYVGQSGLDLKAGKAWMTPQEIEQVAGKANGALFSDPSKAVAAGQWLQQAAADHGVQPESPEQALSALDQARQKAGITAPSAPGPLDQISRPFGEALQNVRDVAGQVGSGLLNTLSGAGRVMQQGQDVNVAGTTAEAAATGEAVAANQANPPLMPVRNAIAESPVGGVLNTVNELRGEDPFAVMADLNKKYGTSMPTDEQATPEDRRRRDNAMLVVGGMTGPVGEGGNIVKGLLGKVPGEVTPPAVSGTAVARQAGTAAEQAALRPQEADRAANILLSKFPEDVRPHLTDAAETFGQFAGQRRGVISDPQAEANAAEVALGTTPEKWIKTPAGKAFNQEQAIALGNTLAQVGKEYDAQLADVLAARAAGNATPEMEAGLASKTLEFGALAGVRSGAAAEAGRALRAFRQTLEGTGYANRNKAIDAAFKAIGGNKEQFAQWVEEFSKIPATDPVARYQMLQGLQKPSWWDRISLLRYASMLSSTTTHMVNAFGNTVNVGLDIANKPIAVGLDVARAGVTGGERTRYMGELAPQVRGLLDGAVSGFWDGWTALRTGVNPRDAGKFENIRSGFQSGNKVVDFAVEAPLRALTFADNVFRGMAFGSQVRAIAARQGIKQGLTGQALRAHIDDVVTNIVQHPDIADEANGLAARTVLQEPNTVASAITSFGRGPGADNVAKRIVREIILPFAKTPANILNQGMEMTPYGALKVARLAKVGETGAATDAAARVAFGSALMVGVGAMAANGMVTGGYPADSKERDTLPTGWQPWSLRLPNGQGGHNYISFSQLGPVAVPLAIAAVAGQSMREGVIADPVTLGSSLGKFMVDQTFLQGLSSIIDAVKDPKRYGENVSEQMATSFVPYAAMSREITRITGQADRDPKGAIQAIQALIPGVAENIPRRQDALGRDIYSTQTGIGAAVSPARYSADQPEPILEAFRSVGSGLPSAPKEIRVTSQITGSTSPPIALNEREQKQYQTLFGQRLQDRLAPILSSPAWQQRTAEARKKELDRQVQLARDYAEGQIYRAMTPADRQKRMQEGRARQQVKPLPVP